MKENDNKLRLEEKKRLGEELVKLTKEIQYYSTLISKVAPAKIGSRAEQR